MMILTVSFIVFVSLRLADAAATVPIPAVTNAPAKMSVDQAFLGYTLVAGSYSPVYCDSGSAFLVLGSEAGCEPSAYFDSNPIEDNTVLGCDGSSVLLGSLENVSCDGGSIQANPGLYTYLSGTCNTDLWYSRAGDQTPLYRVYGCTTGTPNTYYRNLPIITPTSTSTSRLPTALTSNKMTVPPPTTAFSTVVISSTSQATSTQTTTPNPKNGVIKLGFGLGFGLGIPFTALAIFFCFSYRKMSISIRITRPEPPPPYSADRQRALEPVIRIEDFRDQQDGSEEKKFSKAVGYQWED